MTNALPWGGGGLFVLMNAAWIFAGIWGPSMSAPPDPAWVDGFTELIKLLWAGGAGGAAVAWAKS